MSDFMQDFNKYTSSALETSSILAFPCRVMGFVCENTNNAVGWLHFFDATVKPADGAVPLMSYKVATASQLILSWNNAQVPLHWFRTGCVVVLSSTGPTLTAVSSKLFSTIAYI